MRFGLASRTMGRMSPQRRVLWLRPRRLWWLLVASYATGAATDLRMVTAGERAVGISMRPKTLFVALASVVPLFALASQPSGAQPDPALSQPVRAACAADVRSLCAGVLPGGGRIVQCMRDKRDRLSEGCRDALAARLQAQQAQPRK